MADPAATAQNRAPDLPPPGSAWVHPATRRADRWALSAGAPVAATLTLAVAGLLGSLWTEEIRSAWPIAWRVAAGEESRWIAACAVDAGIPCQWTAQAVIFWVAALTGSAIFGWREWAKGRNAANVQAYFLARTVLYANLPAGYATTMELGKQAEVACDLPPGVLQEMTAFFDIERNPHVRSLISMPLLHSTGTGDFTWKWTPEASGEPVTLLNAPNLPSGVLNIHRNSDRMACTDERTLLFYPVLVPLLGVIRDLSRLHDEADAREAPAAERRPKVASTPDVDA